MSLNTPRRGINYPDDLDALAQWPTILANLALRLDEILPRSGTAQTAAITGGADWATLGTFAFPQPFATVPRVIVQNFSAFAGSDTVHLHVILVTTAGFTVRGKCASSKGGQDFAWVAIP